MNATGALFDAGELIGQPRRRSASVKVKVSDDKVTGVGGVALSTGVMTAWPRQPGWLCKTCRWMHRR